MPSSTPRSGVKTRPPATVKTLKPALGDVAREVGEDHVLRAPVDGLEQPGHDVEPVIVLDRGIDRFGRDALDPGDGDAYTKER